MFIVTSYNYEGRDFSWDGRKFNRYWGGFSQTVLDTMDEVQDELNIARKKATGWKGLRVYKIVKSDKRSSRYELVHDEEIEK